MRSASYANAGRTWEDCWRNFARANSLTYLAGRAPIPGQASPPQPRAQLPAGIVIAASHNPVDAGESQQGLIEAGEVLQRLGRQRILRHGFSSYSVIIPNQVRIRTGEYCGTGELIGLVYKR